MKPYFLALATILIVGVGCQLDTSNFQGSSIIAQNGYHAPPAELMARPGPMVDGPGPGVIPMLAPVPPAALVTRTTQIRFLGPLAMHIGWQIPTGYAANQLLAPGHYNFVQGATYRLKLTDFPDREGLVLYPTLQVFPALPRTDAFLAHNGVPLQLTEEDLDQVQSNNFVTKVIYLPDPQNQELAIAGVETLVSTRLDPGVDPIAEADRRGTIMLVLRVGNMDLENADQARPAAVEGAGAEDGPSGVSPVSHQEVDGEKGKYLPPMPIGGITFPGGGVPPAMMMGAPGQPGCPPVNPISGVGPTPAWGMTMTGTPIGLPGPPHLPYGAPAGLQSHTVRNLSRNCLPEPVDHVLIDVKHNPPYRLPPPVKHIQYTENHPVFNQPVVQEGYGAGGYGAAGDPNCPPPN